MTDIREAVFDAIQRQKDAEPPREYLGASGVGRECAKSVWYDFRHAQTKNQFNGRTYRIFDHGNVEEDRIIRDLRLAGYKVINQKPDGGQYGFEAHDGMFRGHIDGVIIIDGEPHLLECKSANEKSFESLQNNGVQSTKPEYYAQMQVYMHCVKGKTPLRKGLLVVVNKNNDDIYTEIVSYDQAFAESMMERAKTIIDTTHDPIASPGWKCSWCSFKNMCKSHSKERDQKVAAVPVERITCRQCVHARLDSGQLYCKRDNRALDFGAQLKACDQHVFLPDFVHFAEPIEYDEEHNGIRYRHESGHEFMQGPNDVTSDMMQFYPANMIFADNVERMLENQFGAKVIKREDAPF